MRRHAIPSSRSLPSWHSRFLTIGATRSRARNVINDWGTGSQRSNLEQGSRELSYDSPAGAVATFVLD